MADRYFITEPVGYSSMGFGTKQVNNNYGSAAHAADWSQEAVSLVPPAISTQLPWHHGQQKAWAKHITGFKLTDRYGAQPDGPWLGATDTIPVGDFVICGSTDAAGNKRKEVYIHSPIGYLTTFSVIVKMLEGHLALPVHERLDKFYSFVLHDLGLDLEKLQRQSSGTQSYPTMAAIAILDRIKLIGDLQAGAFKAAEAAVEAVATLDEMLVAIVKAGYRALALKYHPDVGGGDEKKMIILSEARMQLLDWLKESGIQDV